MQKLDKITKKTQADNKRLMDCNKQHCPKELSNMAITRKLEIKKINALFKDLTSKKITKEQFLEKTREQKERLTQDKHVKELAQCSLDHCKPYVIKVLEGGIRLQEFQCKDEHDKKACTRLKTLRTILKDQPLTIEKYLRFLSVMMQM